MKKKEKKLSSAASPATKVDAAGSSYKTEQLKFSLENPEPFAGLLIEKKVKYYNHPALSMRNRWGDNFTKADSFKQALVEMILTGYSLDSKKNRIGLRLIRAEEQFNPDFETNLEVTEEERILPRKLEDKFEDEDLVSGLECYADFMSPTERGTEKVKIKASRGKVCIIETERGLEYTKINNLYKTPLERKMLRKAAGKIKAKLFKYIGLEIVPKAACQTISKNHIYLFKCVFALGKITGKFRVENKEADTTFHAYSVEDRVEVPGRIIAKYHDGNIYFYALLEKLPDKTGMLKKSFSLFEFYKPEVKEKEEVDLNAKVSFIFGVESAVEESDGGIDE